jgi:hypothetical protein
MSQKKGDGKALHTSKEDEVLRMLAENNRVLKENNQLMKDIKEMLRKVVINTG